MLLRCTLDGLLLEANRNPAGSKLIAFDGDESFEMERVEGIYYELVAATRDDVIWLEQTGYRLLRKAPDFIAIQCEVFA
jgi:hypothetical protein